MSWSMPWRRRCDEYVPDVGSDAPGHELVEGRRRRACRPRRPCRPRAHRDGRDRVRRHRKLREQQMTKRIRTIVLLVRPPVIVLLGLFAALGVAQGGGGNDPARLIESLV